MNTATIITFAVHIVVTASAQQNQNENQNQNCHDFQPKENIDSSRMAGQWTGSSIFNQGFPKITCLRSDLQFNSNNGQLNKKVQFKNENNQQTNRNEIVIPIDGQRAKFSIQNADDTNDESVTAVILATDYDNYAVWSVCSNNQSQQGYRIIVVSRQANGNLFQQHQQQVPQVLRTNNINGQLQQMDQQNC